MSQAVFIVTNVRLGRHVNVSKMITRKAEQSLGLVIYTTLGAIYAQKGNCFFFPRLELVHFGSAVGEGVDLR